MYRYIFYTMRDFTINVSQSRLLVLFLSQDLLVIKIIHGFFLRVICEKSFYYEDNKNWYGFHGTETIIANSISFSLDICLNIYINKGVWYNHTYMYISKVLRFEYVCAKWPNSFIFNVYIIELFKNKLTIIELKIFKKKKNKNRFPSIRRSPRLNFLCFWVQFRKTLQISRIEKSFSCVSIPQHNFILCQIVSELHKNLIFVLGFPYFKIFPFQMV